LTYSYKSTALPAELHGPGRDPMGTAAPLQYGAIRRGGKNA
jgi:hypothetical protein